MVSSCVFLSYFSRWRVGGGLIGFPLFISQEKKESSEKVQDAALIGSAHFFILFISYFTLPFEQCSKKRIHHPHATHTTWSPWTGIHASRYPCPPSPPPSSSSYSLPPSLVIFNPHSFASFRPLLGLNWQASSYLTNILSVFQLHFLGFVRWISSPSTLSARSSSWRTRETPTSASSRS